MVVEVAVWISFSLRVVVTLVVVVKSVRLGIRSSEKVCVLPFDVTTVVGKTVLAAIAIRNGSIDGRGVVRCSVTRGTIVPDVAVKLITTWWKGHLELRVGQSWLAVTYH